MTEILKRMIAAIGIDIGKNCFHEGLKPVLRERPGAALRDQTIGGAFLSKS